MRILPSSNSMLKIDILVYDGADDLDVVGPYRTLKGAEKLGAPFQVRLVNLYDSAEIECSHGLRIKVDSQFVPGQQDVLIVVGGSWLAKGTTGCWAEFQKGTIIDKLKETFALVNAPLICSICTGAMLLAHAGIIGNRMATTHHSCYGELESLGITVLSDRVVEDSGLITAGGVTSGIDLGIYLTKKFGSEEMSKELNLALQYNA
jgi:transcriptional regulator GlxA family with amidase domain